MSIFRVLIEASMQYRDKWEINVRYSKEQLEDNKRAIRIRISVNIYKYTDTSIGLSIQIKRALSSKKVNLTL